MKPAIRSQVSNDQDDYSLATALDLTDAPRVTRQEFREEADVNHLLRRYGVHAVAQARPPHFGEVNWDMDLHSAHIAVERAAQAFTNLPADLREKYVDTRGLLNAMNSGQLADDLRERRNAREKAAAEAQAAAEGAKKGAEGVEHPPAPPLPLKPSEPDKG